MRIKLVAGNWKMNKSFSEAEELLFDISEELQNNKSKAEVVICPPYLYLEMATDIAAENDFAIGAQNVSNFEKGAYTGEISAGMLHKMDVSYCIVGHSERRQYFNETNQVIAEKVKQLISNDITPIFCCGEKLEDRESGKHFEVVKSQIKEALFDLESDKISSVIIAYEPVWAIGTGKTATPEQAQEMHEFIRNTIKDKFTQKVSDNITILYGGSCNAKNAKELFACKDIDGGLIGGASLVAEDFVKIVNSF
ncbi:MAG: triose-phosphate isomerase [Lentimicrobiaceae bacterium]|nr:triose-phosphate isomerase [Lentimicrobiaceae bacterium]